MSENDSAETDAPETGTAPDAEPTTLEEQVEFYKAQNRKLEDRLRSKSADPERNAPLLRKQRDQLQKDLDHIKQQSMSDQEKAVAAARSEGQAEAIKSGAAKVARAELKAAAKGVIADGIVAVIDVSQFLDDDGEVDTAAIAQFVTDNTPAPAVDDGKPPFVDFGQGKRANAPASDDPLLAEISHKLGVH